MQSMCGLCTYRLAELYKMLSDVSETWTPKGIPRTRKPCSHASLHHPYPRLDLFLFAFLWTRCIFMVEYFPMEYLSLHPQWCPAPMLGLRMLCYITSYKPNWSKAWLDSAVPCCPPCPPPPFYQNSQMHARLQTLEFPTQSITKDAWSSLAKEAPFCISL